METSTAKNWIVKSRHIVSVFEEKMRDGETPSGTIEGTLRIWNEEILVLGIIARKHPMEAHILANLILRWEALCKELRRKAH